MTDGSVWDEVLDTEHVTVVRTYIERWPRKGKPSEKVVVVVVEALANIVVRVTREATARLDRLAGLRMIGIDEKSWGQRRRST